MKQEEVQKTVRERYGRIAKESSSGLLWWLCVNFENQSMLRE